MFDIICVTDRKLCAEDIVTRIERLAACRPSAVMLREKDLEEEQYLRLAEKAKRACDVYGVELVLHSFPGAAKKLGCPLHLPMPALMKPGREDRRDIVGVSASCHSVREAIEAQKRGCSFITFGHVFDTECKKGLPARGTELLKAVCKSVSIPVYAIGGIGCDNAAEAINAGAKGVCVMSGAMTCDKTEKYIALLRQSFDGSPLKNTLREDL